MFDEIKIRSTFFQLNFVLIFFCALFLWLNNLLYPNYSGDLSNDHVIHHADLATLDPSPWLIASRTLANNTSKITEQDQQLQLQLVEYINKHERRALSLPDISPHQEYADFARDLAVSLANGTLQKNIFDQDANAMALSKFNDRENRFVIKQTEITTSNINQVSETEISEIAQGLRTPMLNSAIMQDIGVAVHSKDKKVFVVMYLANTLLEYDVPFPTSGDLSLTASLLPNHQQRNIQIRMTEYKRGWFTAVDQTPDVHAAKIQGDQLTLAEVISPDGWTKIQFIVDGAPWNRGRAIQADRK